MKHRRDIWTASQQKDAAMEKAAWWLREVRTYPAEWTGLEADARKKLQVATMEAAAARWGAEQAYSEAKGGAA